MLFKRVNRESPDQVFIICKNGDATKKSGGEAVCFDFGDAKDGYTVITPATAMLAAFAGIVADNEEIGAGGFGKVQVYGFHPGVFIAGSTAAPGSLLKPVNAATNLTLSVLHASSTTATSDEAISFVIAGETACLKATSTVGLKYKAFIRAM